MYGFYGGTITLSRHTDIDLSGLDPTAIINYVPEPNLILLLFLSIMGVIARKPLSERKRVTTVTRRFNDGRRGKFFNYKVS